MSGPWEKYGGQSEPSAGPWAKYSQPAEEPSEPTVAVNGDYRDKYSGQGLIQGNLNYLKDYISGLGGAATKERPQDISTSTGQIGNAIGLGETALNLGSSALAPLFALPDYAITKMGLDDPRNPSGTYAGAREKYVYEPRTSAGKTGAEVAGAALKPVGDAFSLIGSGYGDIAGQFGASPQTQNEIRDIAPDVVAAGLTAGQLRSSVKPQEQQPIPTTEELRTAKNAAYKAGNESNILTTPEQNSKAIENIDSALKSEHAIVDPDLHPKSSALLRRLRAQKDQPLTVPEAESLRQLALEVERDIDPVTKQPTADAFRAGVILDELDNSLESLSANAPARALNSRFKRSQMIDEMVRRAEIKAGAHYTQAGMEHALRKEFERLALNPRRMRGLTMEQKAAIEKVAKGGPLENSLRALGKFDPTTSVVSAAGSLGAGALLGMKTGGLGLALPPAGFIGRRAATRLTGRNVDLAREALVGRQPATVPSVPAAAQSAAMTGELMQRPPLALPAPNIVAGSRSAPGTAYAREQMGLTPDVEAAGMFHPGAPRQSVPLPPLALPYRASQGAADYVADAAGNVGTAADLQATGLTPDVIAAMRQHPGRARPAAPVEPKKPLALPLLSRRPMTVDAQGRVAATPAEIDAYLRDLGMDRMSNVRQPRAEPDMGGLLGEEPQTGGLLGTPARTANQIRRDLRKLDQKLKSLPAGQALDSPQMVALASEWARLRAELSRAESQGASP